MNRKEDFLKGSVKVRIEGDGMERFFNIAAQRGLTAREIRTEKRTKRAGHAETNEKEGNVCFLTSPADFKRMKPVAKKTAVHLKIVEKHGFPFWMIFGKKRSLWVAGLAAFFLLIGYSSFFLWDISFDGNRRFTDETLLQFMDEIPVRCGMKKSRISCEKLEYEIRNAFPQISWVSAELSGTRLIVHVKENDRILKTEEQDKRPCNLLAKTDGTVTKVIVRSGISRVKTGDEVKAGDILVLGELPIYDDSETFVKANLVHADADIYAETSRNVSFKIPGTKEIRTETGASRHGIFLKFPGAEWCFLMPSVKKNAKWQIFLEETKLRLSKNFYLPVYAGILTAKEYVPYEKVLKREDVSRAAERYLNEYMENLTEKGIQILGSDVKIERSESDWKIHGTLTVVEEIAKESFIPEDQKEIQTVDEYH